VWCTDSARSLERVETPLLLEITQETGVPNLRKSATGRINTEQEVLLRPNTRMVITGEREEVHLGRKTRVLEAKEVTAPRQSVEAKSMQTGPRGGLFYVSANGTKVYTGRADAASAASDAVQTLAALDPEALADALERAARR
jgi:hypothetical protein